jgi:hypothetical protein
MSLTAATLLPGLLLIVLGVLFLISNSAIVSMWKALPRSKVAAYAFFGLGAAWFVSLVWNLSEADMIIFSSPTPFVIGFTALAVLSFYYVPDFLAVRGLSILTLIAAWPVLMAGYMEFRYPQINFLKVFVYVCIALAIYLGAAPYRLRDFFQWLFSTKGRPRALGVVLTAYGLLLTGVAFSY